MAFAGRRYAARSLPQIISDADNTVTTLTLVKLNKHEMQVNFFHILSRNKWFFCFFFAGPGIPRGNSAELVLEELWV